MWQLVVGKMRSIYMEQIENEYMYINTSMKNRTQTEGNILERGNSWGNDKEAGSEMCACVCACMRNSKGRVTVSWFSHLVEQIVIYSWRAFEVIVL